MTKKNYMDDMLRRQAYIQENMPKSDPFDKGIMKAVESARKSVQMDEEQNNRALQGAIGSFGQQIHAMPRVKGFMANFAQAGRALAPALQTYTQQEDIAQKANRQAIQEAQAARAAEEAKAAQLEQQAYTREMAAEQQDFQRAQLGEQRAANAAKLDEQRAYRQGKIERDQAKEIYVNTDLINTGEFHAIDGKTSRKDLGKQYSVAGNLYHEAQGIKQDYKKMLETLEEAGLPANPITLNAAVRAGSGFFSGFGNQDTIQRKLATQYDQLNSRIERLAMQYEQADKHRGLTDFTVKYANQKHLFPKMGDNPDIFLGKLDHLYHDSERAYKALDASLKDGVYINKENYDRYLEYKKTLDKGRSAGSDYIVPSPPPQVGGGKKVLMRDPGTGEERDVPQEDVQRGIDDFGLEVVHE